MLDYSNIRELLNKAIEEKQSTINTKTVDTDSSTSKPNSFNKINEIIKENIKKKQEEVASKANNVKSAKNYEVANKTIKEENNPFRIFFNKNKSE